VEKTPKDRFKALPQVRRTHRHRNSITFDPCARRARLPIESSIFGKEYHEMIALWRHRADKQAGSM
jgi:hypothetical protein